MRIDSSAENSRHLQLGNNKLCQAGFCLLKWIISCHSHGILKAVLMEILLLRSKCKPYRSNYEIMCEKSHFGNRITDRKW